MFCKAKSVTFRVLLTLLVIEQSVCLLSLCEVRFWFRITLIMRSLMFLSVVWTARWSTASSTAHPAAMVSQSPTTCTALWKTWSCTTTRPHWSSTTTHSTCGWRTQCMHRCPQAPGDEDSPPKNKLSRLMGGCSEQQQQQQKNMLTKKRNTCCNTHVSHLGVIYFYKNNLEGILSKDCLICTRKF